MMTSRIKEQKTASNLPARHRAERIWNGGLFLSTLLGVLFLVLLLVKIVNDSFGYMVTEYGVSPNAMAVNGVPVWDLPKEDQVLFLQENITPGRFKTLMKENALLDRSQKEIDSAYHAGDRRAKSCPNMDAQPNRSSRSSEIETTASQDYPEGELSFKAWLNWDFITSPQSSDPLSPEFEQPLWVRSS